MTVLQEDLLGCAVACVAGLRNISYKKAIKYFDNPQNARFNGYYCRDIVTALKRSGVEHPKWIYIKHKEKSKIYCQGTIVFIARDKRYPDGHYLLRVEKGWMDPWINFPNIGAAKAGIRKRLPGSPIYAIYTT